MNFQKYIGPILLFTLLTVAFHYLFFSEHTVDPIFSIPNIMVVLAAVIYYHTSFRRKIIELPTNKFERIIFIQSLCFRIVFMLVLTYIFYLITGGLLNVEAIDAKAYHELAIKMADGLRNKYYYNKSLLFKNFDDNGYFHFISIVYLFTNNSIIFFRLVQCLLGSLSVLLIYRITCRIFKNEVAARYSALIAVPFPLFLVYSAVLLKVTVLVFSILLIIYSLYNISENGFKIKWLLFTVIGLVACATMRFLYVLMLLSSFSFFILLNVKKMKGKYINVFISFAIIVGLLLSISGTLGFKEEALMKSSVYISSLKIKNEETTQKKVSLGGQNITKNTIFNYSRKFGGKLLFVPFSFSFPFPTLVKTNMYKYNQTLKWYHIGGILLWNFLAFFSILGFFAIVKNNFRGSSMILFLTMLFLVVLIKGFIITSIRHNAPKIAIMLIFAGIGIEYKIKNKYLYFLIYSFCISIAVIGFSYFKLKARGIF